MGLFHDRTPKATNAVSDLGLSLWATAPTGTQIAIYASKEA